MLGSMNANSLDIQFRVRFYKGESIAVGPGKVALLEAIAAQGSISAAAKSIGMSYRRAWLLIDDLNQMLVAPAVATATGGERGGGATLTVTGQKLIAHYRKIEADAATASAASIRALKKLIAS